MDELQFRGGLVFGLGIMEESYRLLEEVRETVGDIISDSQLDSIEAAMFELKEAEDSISKILEKLDDGSITFSYT